MKLAAFLHWGAVAVRALDWPTLRFEKAATQPNINPFKATGGATGRRTAAALPTREACFVDTKGQWGGFLSMLASTTRVAAMRNHNRGIEPVRSESRHTWLAARFRRVGRAVATL